jgi:triosephosphate isomerase
LFAALKNRLDPQETLDLTLKVRGLVGPDRQGMVGLCPSSIAIPWASSCRGALLLAAQNCGWTRSYSLTGEIAVRDLSMFSIAHCIVGHSERRTYLGETEEIIQRRLEALLAGSITPILCVGETLDQRRAGSSTQAVKAQLGSLKAAFSRCGITPDAEKVIIAYEPMWAISTAGSDLALEPTQAAESHDLVRRSLDELFGHGFGAKTSIIFGGSVNASNAVGFFGHPDIDGGLVGAGMQTADGFSDVLRAFYGTGPQAFAIAPTPA